MNQAAGFIHAADYLRREIESELNSVGLLCRVFGRGKAIHSLQKKIQTNPEKYSPQGKLIQDAVGVRVVLYFQEDITIVEHILKNKYKCDERSSTIDKPSNTEFSVSRYNLIFRLPQELLRDIPPPSQNLPIDRAFEVQIRTILSEGWHEIEHDLRYKRREDWNGHDDLSRGLNGVVATLETAEWSMRKIFDDLAYKHYKTRKWDAMLHSSLRMRTVAPLSWEITTFFDENPSAAKRLIRIDRSQLFLTLTRLTPRLPLTANNIIYVWNQVNLHNNEITKLTPEIILNSIKNASLD